MSIQKIMISAATISALAALAVPASAQSAPAQGVQAQAAPVQAYRVGPGGWVKPNKKPPAPTGSSGGGWSPAPNPGGSSGGATSIPEPSNLVMLAVGVTGLVAGRIAARRRRKQG
ncbi:MAG: hypothetical protein U5J78_03615 [Parasphingorhabdus sp.]|nr:hypothetical protein [Parasphingorhabdus sp.]